jgi:hypothetical protein
MSNQPANSHIPTITYFRPEQLVFHVKGNLRHDFDAQKTITGLLEWAKGFSGPRGIRLSASERVFGFDAVEVSAAPTKPGKDEITYQPPPVEPQPPFSMIFVDAISDNWQKSLQSQDEEEREKLRRQALEALLALAIDLDNKDNREKAPGGNLEAVTPNWLLGGSASSPGSTGGPGIRPTPYDGSSKTEEYLFHTLPAIQGEPVGGRLDEPAVDVVVAILDTAPTLETEEEILSAQLDNLYKQWVENKPEAEQHPLLKSLLGPEGKLKKVYLDDDVDKPIPGVWPDGYIQAEDHDYLMTDHGLFVAGIIHSIAPQAELHLFQVLNRYGVGDLLSITQALQKIRDDDETFPKDRLLVNLSLTIHLPLAKEHGRKGKKPDSLLDKIWNEIQKDKKWAEHQVESINRLCGGFHAQGGKVIAAAGNNAEKGKGRPQACFPAAMDSVLGVGALPKARKPNNPSDKVEAASYSNRSDKPEITGITTLGGDEGDKQGLLGIYVGEFPPPHSSQSANGWGWWGGTSFAAPIITGMAAAVRGFIPGLATMEAAVGELFEVEPYKTKNFDEDVLYVMQGSGIS